MKVGISVWVGGGCGCDSGGFEAILSVFYTGVRFVRLGKVLCLLTERMFIRFERVGTKRGGKRLDRSCGWW